MSILQNSNAISAGGGYDINNSLRFRSSASAYLKRVPASAGSRTTWTWSSWIKRGALADCDLFGTYTGNTDTDFLDINIYNNTLRIGAWFTGFLATTQVLRDPSAWYHIVVAVDTTQATASNRIKMYINGIQVTSFGTANYPAQNATLAVNQAGNTYIGYAGGGGWGYFDGYMAEQYFIDGSAKTPSDFGETDTTTGVWKPKAYTGTYGTNGFYLPFSSYSTTGGLFSSYYGSFSGSNNLTSTFSSNSIFSGDSTFECWAYITTTTGQQAFFRSNTSGVGFNIGSSGSAIQLDDTANGGSVLTTPSGVISANTWTHIAVTRSGNTFTIYVNGVSQASSSSIYSYYTTATTGFIIGAFQTSGSNNPLTGRLSNLRVTKSVVYSSNFTPPTSALTAISNTQLLTLQNSSIVDNSTNGYSITNNGSVTTTSSSSIGYLGYNANDESGNGNNWLTNNMNVATSSATTYDAMIDSPTLTSATVANYCVMNPLYTYLGRVTTFTNGNLNVQAGSAAYTPTVGTIAIPNTGKWYFEVTLVSNNGSGNNQACGIRDTTSEVSGNYNLYLDATGSGYIDVTKNGVTSGNYGAYSNGQVYQFAIDMDNSKSWIGINNTWLDSGNPSTGSNSIYTPNLNTTYYPYFLGYSSGVSAFNFGQRPFSYTPPTGFNRLNTYNLPDSTIKKGNSYMDATLWTGGQSSPFSVTNAGSFKPDLVWAKERSSASSNRLYDSVRGTGVALLSNSTAAEQTEANTGVSAFQTAGFQITNSNGVAPYLNDTSQTYVGWQWQAGQGSTSSNTSGSITSTVSVNTTAGFSIVTYTGNATSGATVGHGLGVAPKMIIFKGRSSTFDWMVYHTSLGNTNYLRLNQTDASAASVSAFNNTSPTSTVFSLGDGSLGNQASATQVAYCFAEIAGFSKFGSYTGNGSSDGPFVYLGFRPRWVLLKRTDTAGDNWAVLDTSRDTYNFLDKYLFANSSLAESSTGSGNAFDYLSNGFKVRSTGGGQNASGGTYIYAAFAENPFKNSLAR